MFISCAAFLLCEFSIAAILYLSFFTLFTIFTVLSCLVFSSLLFFVSFFSYLSGILVEEDPGCPFFLEGEERHQKFECGKTRQKRKKKELWQTTIIYCTCV